MYGKIRFKSEASLARFLKEFVGSTAVFTVEQEGDYSWLLEFKGGY